MSPNNLDPVAPWLRDLVTPANPAAPKVDITKPVVDAPKVEMAPVVDAPKIDAPVVTTDAPVITTPNVPVDAPVVVPEVKVETPIAPKVDDVKPEVKVNEDPLVKEPEIKPLDKAVIPEAPVVPTPEVK